MPEEPALRRDVEADWKRFNTDLGTETANVSYYYLLPHEDILLGPFAEGLPPGEARVLKPVYPALRWFLGICLGLGATRTKRSLDGIRKTFDAVDARLAGGAEFLVGGTLTLSDLAFAASAAPFLLPQGYTTPMPPLSSMPAEMQNPKTVGNSSGKVAPMAARASRSFRASPCRVSGRTSSAAARPWRVSWAR